MPSKLVERIGSPPARAARFHFTFFMLPGVFVPLLPLWLDSEGVTKSQIGAMIAGPVLLMIVLNMFIGRIADHARDWRSVLIFASFLACVPAFGLFFVDGPLMVVIVWSMVMIAQMAMMPVIDSATARMARRIGADFGRIRLWGTVGFLVTSLVMGFLFQIFGIVMFLPTILAVCVIRALISLQLPYFRTSGTTIVPPVEKGVDGEGLGEVAKVNPLIATRVKEVLRPWFLLVLLGIALIQASHVPQIAFGTFSWIKAGIVGSMIGGLWALSALTEIAVMANYKRLLTKFSARYLLLVGGIFSLVRWFGFALEPNILGYVLLQTLHIGSFGLTFVGAIAFISNWTSDDISTQAQSFSIILRQICTMTVAATFGFAFGAFGAVAYFIPVGMCVVGIGFIVASLMMMGPKKLVEQA